MGCFHCRKADMPARAYLLFGRSVGIRTRGLLDPNQARYQASPHPVSLFIIAAFGAFVKHKSLPLWGRCPRRGRMRAVLVWIHTGTPAKWYRPHPTSLALGHLPQRGRHYSSVMSRSSKSICVPLFWACHCSLVIRMARGLLPWKGPTMPFSSISSTIRAARA